MNDLEVTPQEEADLRSLLHAAATDLDIQAANVPRPDTLVVPAVIGRSRHRRTVGAIAAAAAAAVTVGGVLWANGRGGDVPPLAVGPAASGSIPGTSPTPEMPGLDDWRRGTGIWRLPDPASGLRVEQALLTPTGAPPWLVALDHAGDGRRFLAVSLLMSEQGFNSDPGSAGHQTTVGGMDVYTAPPGSVADPAVTWVTIRADGDRGGLSIVSRGTAGDDVWAYANDLATLLGQAPGPVTGQKVVEAMQAATPPTGLTPSWGAADPVEVLDGRLTGTALTLRLAAPDGAAFQVALDPPLVGSPEATRIAWVLTSRSQRVTAADLLDGATTLWTFDESSSQLEGFADDSTMISITGPATRDSLTVAIKSLRATDEATARRRLRADGVALGTVTPDGLTPTTTAPDETGHTSTTAGPSNGFDRTSTTVP
ncbi:MAG: hypothetical protein JST64_03325 [Actinobacteria bacterium]|nr:hypothetical protein [Actinomycetota bacterium]